MIVNLSGGKMMGVLATLSGDAKRPRLVLRSAHLISRSPFGCGAGVSGVATVLTDTPDSLEPKPT